MQKSLYHLFSFPTNTSSLGHTLCGFKNLAFWTILNSPLPLPILCLSRDHRTGQQEGAQVHALHHLPFRSADGPDAVWWPAHLRCGDSLWGERPLSFYLPPLSAAGQGAAEPHTSAAGNQPRGPTLHPHPRQWHKGGELPWPSHQVNPEQPSYLVDALSMGTVIIIIINNSIMVITSIYWFLIF